MGSNQFADRTNCNDGSKIGKIMAEPHIAVAEAIEEEVEERVEGAEAAAAAALEAAEEKIENAEEMAAQIALAALNTELGGRVAALSERIEKWPQELASVESRIMQAVETRLAQPPTVPVVIIPEKEVSSTPLPQSPETLIVDPLTGKASKEKENISGEKNRVTYL